MDMNFATVLPEFASTKTEYWDSLPNFLLLQKVSETEKTLVQEATNVVKIIEVLNLKCLKQRKLRFRIKNVFDIKTK